MERRLRVGNDNYCGYLFMHMNFIDISGGVLGENLMRGHDAVFNVENGRVGLAERNYIYNRVTEEKE